MNNIQPDTPPVSTFFNTPLFSHDSTHAIPDTLANAVPNTTPDDVEMLSRLDTFTLPTLRLPQIAPALVIAKRQRSLPSLSSPVLITPLPMNTPMHTKARQLVKQEILSSTPVTDEAHTAYVVQKKLSIGDTALPNTTHQGHIREVEGIMHIPRSMNRATQPTIVDAIIACSTLILICFCILMFIYIIGL